MTIGQRLELIKNYIVVKSFLKNKVYKAISNAEIKEELDKQGKGKDNRNDSDYDPNELEMGIKVEMEHTDDKGIAKKIAQDHLTEFKNYYTKLKEMEDELKEEGKKKTVPSIEAVKKFLKDNPNPDDDKVHAWSKKNGYDNHKVEALFYKLATQAIKEEK
jgi:hypothetical protein